MFQALHAQLLQHKYAINTAMLGDQSQLAWSNLGLWQADRHYVAACQALAMQLADSIHLNSNDILLDLACGQGASLELWNKKYKIQNISAVELQKNHVLHIQKHTQFLNSIQCDSFLNLKVRTFEQQFSAVLCIDAAYHVNLNAFIQSVKPLMQPNARLAFHTLIMDEAFLNLTFWQRKKYMYVLKSADVNLADLQTQDTLQATLLQYGFTQVVVTDLTEQVLAGFADYIETADLNLTGLDGFKIKMTAKLCRKLCQDGWIRYVAVAAF